MIQNKRAALFASSLAALTISAFASCGTETSASAESNTPVVNQPEAATSDSAGAPLDSKPTLAKIVDDSDAEAPKPMEKIAEFIASKNIDKEKAGWKTRLPKPPKLKFGEEQVILWNLDTTEGPITVQLMQNVAPMHVSSTIYLTELGFYDDLIFHRVIKGFMAQGGCPLGKGHGSPGYKYDGEFDKNVKHDRPGLLSTANNYPRLGTDGSQFFLTFVPTPHLDGKHTIFGAVIEGMDVVKKLESFGSQRGATTKKLLINKATITVK
jgi:peptidyl-prolyl cis-trans isomerase B (cyclophilin B)